MLTTKIVLRIPNINDKGLAPLSLRITENRKTNYIALGIMIPPKYWDDENFRIKNSFPDAQDLNAFIKKRTAEIETAFLKNNGDTLRSVTIDKVKEEIYGKKPINFFDFANDDIKRFFNEKKVNTYLRSQSIINKIKLFAKNDNLTFHHLTAKFLERYEQWCRSEMSNKVNTIHRDLKYLRKLCNLAERRNMISRAQNPFNNYTLKYVEPPIVFLKEAELVKLEKLKLTKGSKREVFRDIFLFTCYGIGQRVSDSFLLKVKKFDGQNIEVVAQKTGTQKFIKLPQKALEIINKYTRADSKPDDYIFPIFNSDQCLDDPFVLRTEMGRATALYNNALKVFAKKAELPLRLTTHVARHTWATRAGTKGIRLEIIQFVLGHTDIKQTMRYRHVIDAEVNHAMALLD